MKKILYRRERMGSMATLILTLAQVGIAYLLSENSTRAMIISLRQAPIRQIAGTLGLGLAFFNY